MNRPAGGAAASAHLWDPAGECAPLAKRPERHAAMIWVHGGVHSNWGTGMFPFVREAVERGYFIIDGPSGAAGHGITRPGFDGIACFGFVNRFTYGNFGDPSQFGLEC